MPAEKTNTLLIKTPEGIVFALQLAGPVTRFVAWSVDVLCVIALAILASRLTSLAGWISGDFANALMTVGYFVISAGYGMALEWFWRGQTIGKRLLRLRVVDAHGLRLHFSQIAIRNLLRFVDLLPVCYMVGGLACFFSRKAQRL